MRKLSVILLFLLIGSIIVSCSYFQKQTPNLKEAVIEKDYQIDSLQNVMQEKQKEFGKRQKKYIWEIENLKIRLDESQTNLDSLLVDYQNFLSKNENDSLAFQGRVEILKSDISEYQNQIREYKKQIQLMSKKIVHIKKQKSKEKFENLSQKLDKLRQKNKRLESRMNIAYILGIVVFLLAVSLLVLYCYEKKH